MPLTKTMISDAKNIMRKITTEVKTTEALTKTKILDMKRVFGIATKVQSKYAI